LSFTVALLHYTAPPVVGGVETVVGAQARAFAAAGYRTRVLAGRGASPGPGVEFVRVPMADTRHPRVLEFRPSLHDGQVPTGFSDVVDELAAQLARNLGDVEVLIAHNVASLPLNLALTAALRRVADAPGGPAVIAWHHDIAGTAAHYRRVLWPGYPWELLLTPWPGVRNVAISRARAAELSEATGIREDAITVIPNGIDLGRALGLAPATSRLLDQLDLAAAGPILLTPARMTPRKNLDLGVRVLAEIRSRGLDGRLLLTGSLDPHDPHSAIHRDDVAGVASSLGVANAVHILAEHLGRPSGRRLVADLFRVADVLFLPSTDEGFGLPILEAGATRLPVVCSDVPALRELAGAEATYFDPSAAPGEIADLVLGRLVADPSHRLASRVRARYSWSGIFRHRIAPLVAEVARERAGVARSS
jgi:glycosyltransferase involved in cell wall biosynthesis